MGLEAVKLELIEWLTKLNNESTIDYLKVIKDATEENSDWWSELSKDEKDGIDRGLRDVEKGRLTSHDDVKAKYGL